MQAIKGNRLKTVAIDTQRKVATSPCRLTWAKVSLRLTDT